LSQLGYARPRYTHEGEGDDGNDFDKFKQADEALARKIWAVLQYHYPGHPWGVAVQHSQGVAMVQIPPYVNWSFVIHLNTLNGDPGMKSVVRAGGEMLERYSIPRSGFKIENFITAMDALPIGARRPPE